MKRFFLTLCVSLTFFHPTIAHTSPLPEFPFVTVSCESSREMKPNRVDISFYIEAFDENASAALKAHSETVGQVLSILSDLDIETSQITSLEMSKQTVRERDEDYNALAILGYEIGQPFTLSLDDLDNFTAITDQLIQLNLVSNIQSQFDVKEREEIELALIVEAGEKAGKKAEQLTKGLGVSIESVYGITDKGSFADAFASFGVNTERMTVTGALLRSEKALFIPQTITLSKTIHVVYKISNIIR